LTLSRLENDQGPVREEIVDMRVLLDDIYQDGQLLSSRDMC